ncbi:hypothetical protein GA0115259_1024014 [Streptomyces sp. MnatMP-M17]|nr:hypothetical protein GA0115259_1024014 [Streptomyces sp. MnatMP-M17]
MKMLIFVAEFGAAAGQNHAEAMEVSKDPA